MDPTPFWFHDFHADLQGTISKVQASFVSTDVVFKLKPDLNHPLVALFHAAADPAPVHSQNPFRQFPKKRTSENKRVAFGLATKFSPNRRVILVIRALTCRFQSGLLGSSNVHMWDIGLSAIPKRDSYSYHSTKHCFPQPFTLPLVGGLDWWIGLVAWRLWGLPFNFL